MRRIERQTSDQIAFASDARAGSIMSLSPNETQDQLRKRCHYLRLATGRS
jgi:hypothetical protein